MGLSVPTSASIFLIGAILICSLTYPVVDAGLEESADSFGTQHDKRLATQNTDFRIDNTTYNATRNELRINMTNTGAESLTVDRTDVLLDGRYTAPSETLVDGNPDNPKWHSGTQLNVTIDTDSKPGQVKVVVDHGVARVDTEVTNI